MEKLYFLIALMYLMVLKERPYMYTKLYLLLLACIISGISYAQTPAWLPTNGLVAWYPFNGNAVDESLNTNDGNMLGASLVADRSGNANSACEFNGIDNYIEVPDHSSLRVRRITVTAWVNADYGQPMQILYKGDYNTAAAEAYGLDMTLRFSFKYNSNCTPGSSWVTSPYNTPIASGSWVFLASSYDGSVVRNYVNGTQVSVTPFSGLIDTCAGSGLRIGYQNSPNPNAFKGSIDDIAIYNRALTDCEIKHIFQQIPQPVTAHPQNQNVNSGQPAFFGIDASGTGLTYQWEVNTGSGGFVGVSNGGVYTGATTDTLRISSASGGMSGYTYRCTVYNNGCVYPSNNATLTVNTTSVHEAEKARLYSVFPNPARSIITIQAPALLKGKAYTITDLPGRVMLYKTLQGATTTVDIAALPAGIYLLRVEEGGDAMKIVKE